MEGTQPDTFPKQYSFSQAGEEPLGDQDEGTRSVVLPKRMAKKTLGKKCELLEELSKQAEYLGCWKKLLDLLQGEGGGGMRWPRVRDQATLRCLP